jgi:predicted acyl esterase
MKLFMTLARFLTFVCVLVFWIANGWQSFAQDTNKKQNDQVKLESNQVELIEVSEVAGQCPNQTGTTLRLKVTSSNAIDVRVYSQTLRARQVFADYKNKKQGDEVTSYTCLEKGKFKVQTRAASDSPWK